MKKLLAKFAFLDFERVIHSIKTVIACLLGFLTTRLLQLPNEQWVIITILVVLCAQSRIGAMLQKSYMRFLGTLIGGMIAGVTLLIFGPHPAAVITVLCLAALCFSYIAESPSVLSDAGTIGAVTVAIILLSPQQSLFYAVDRFLEINLGIVIALLISRFIWPLHSRNRLLHAITITLDELNNFYAKLVQAEFSHTELLDMAYEEKIISGLIKQRKLFEEVLRESFSPLPIISEFRKILYCEREILRNISLMYSALQSISAETCMALSDGAALNQLHIQIGTALEVLITTLQTQKKPDQPIFIALPANWKKQIKASVEVVAADILEEDILQIDSFLFCAERLIGQLAELLEEMHKLFISK